jgi:hypothetical protein
MSGLPEKAETFRRTDGACRGALQAQAWPALQSNRDAGRRQEGKATLGKKLAHDIKSIKEAAASSCFVFKKQSSTDEWETPHPTISLLSFGRPFIKAFVGLDCPSMYL